MKSLRTLLALVLLAGCSWAQTSIKQTVFTAQASTTHSVTMPQVVGGTGSHQVVYCPNASVATIAITIEGSNDSIKADATDGHWVTISGIGTDASSANCHVLSAGQYFPAVRVNLSTLTGVGAKVSAWYAGSSGMIENKVGFGGASFVQGGDSVGQPLQLNPFVQATLDGNGLITPRFACTKGLPLNLTFGGAGNLELVALSGTKVIRVCHISFTSSVSANFSLTQGTGVNCAAATAQVTDAYTAINSLALDLGYDSAAFLTAGNALCLNASGAAIVKGFLAYAQY